MHVWSCRKISNRRIQEQKLSERSIQHQNQQFTTIVNHLNHDFQSQNEETKKKLYTITNPPEFDIDCDICTIPGTNDNLPSCIYRGTNFGEEKIVKNPISDETPSNRNAVVLYKKELNLLLKLLQESVIKDGHGGSEQRDCQ